MISSPQTISTRRLTIEDYDAVATLYGSTDRWMETQMTDEFFKENLEVARRDYLLGDGSRVLMGTFQGDQLVLSGGLFFWSRMPFCTILRLVGNIEAMSAITFTRCIISLYDGLLDEIEAHKCTRFYMLTSSNHLSTLARVGVKLHRLGRDYLMTVEAIVPPNIKPAEDYVWSMMGEKTWPVPLVLRAGTAYNHIRTFDKSIVGDDVLNAWSSNTDR